ncbi:integrase, partial [Candidatus Hakubella thermalkaliphila]
AATLEFNELSLIFPNQAGQPMDRSNLQVRIFEPALKKGGLRKIRWHDLRHSYASMLINDGANIKYVQKQLGHASCQVTLDTYSHLIREAGWEAIGKLDGLLSTQGDMVRIAESKVGHEVSMM